MRTIGARSMRSAKPRSKSQVLGYRPTMPYDGIAEKLGASLVRVAGLERYESRPGRREGQMLTEQTMALDDSDMTPGHVLALSRAWWRDSGAGSCDANRLTMP